MTFEEKTDQGKMSKFQKKSLGFCLPWWALLLDREIPAEGVDRGGGGGDGSVNAKGSTTPDPLDFTSDMIWGFWVLYAGWLSFLKTEQDF